MPFGFGALAHALGLGTQLPEPSLKQTLSRFSEYSCFNGERHFACRIKSRELLRDAIYLKLAGLKALAKLAHAQEL